MTPEQFSLPWRPLKALAHLASRDTSRYILGGICVEIGKKSIHLVATNGVALGVCNVPVTAVTDKPEKQGTIVMPIDWLNKFSFDDKHSEVEITTKDLKFEVEYRGTSIRSKLIEGNFPGWRSVIPKEKFTPTQHFDFNTFKMRAFIKVSEVLCGKNTPCIRIKSHGDLMPFSIFVSDPNFYGVLMPLNMVDNIPSWIKDE